MPDDRERPELVRDATHEAHLALCKNQRERVEYVCEVLAASGSLGSGAVLDWLELYGFLPRRDAQKSNVRTLVSKWRKARGLDDTGGPIPTITPEMLEILDERAAASKTADVPAPRPARPLSVVPAPVETPADDDGTPATPPADPREPADQATPAEVPADPAPAADVPPAAPAEVPAAEAAPVPAPARKRRGTWAAVVVAAAATGLSAEGNLRWFSEDLHVQAPFIYGVFAVMELALLACSWMMFEHVRDHGRPGPMRVVAWAICGVSAFAAMQVFGPYDGLLRAIVGPVGALIFLHAALGIEIRAGKGRTTVWAKIGREFRERFLSRLGLADDDRTALQRTRERAAVRLAYLATASGWVPFRAARMRRANRLAGTAHDPAMKARVEREHHSLDQLARLREVKHGDFWSTR